MIRCLAYGRSEDANILFAVAFDKRHRGPGVRAAAVHPGGIRTELGRHIDSSRLEKIVQEIDQQLAAQGKAPFQSRPSRRELQHRCGLLWSPQLTKSVGDIARTAMSANRAGPRDHHRHQRGVRGYALDANNAEALWKKMKSWWGIFLVLFTATANSSRKNGMEERND